MARRELIIITVTAKEKEAFKAACKKDGRSMASVMRDMLLEYTAGFNRESK